MSGERITLTEHEVDCVSFIGRACDCDGEQVEYAPASEVARLGEAIERALEPLGTGECPVNTCEGCEYEVQEAIRILEVALHPAEEPIRETRP